MANQKRIRIIHGGVYNSDGTAVPKGTEMDVPANFNSWLGKWVEVSTQAGKTLEVATPEASTEPQASQAAAEYREYFGEEPHGRMKEETMRRKVKEAREEQQAQGGE